MHAKFHPRRGCLLLAGGALLLLLLLMGLAVVFVQRPSLPAQGADLLRGVLGDRVVASLEMAAFQAQDMLQKARYALGLATPAAPWQSPTETPLPRDTPSAQIAPAPQTAAPASPTPPSPATPAPAAWQPAPLTPLGSLAGEGQWSPYLQDASGRTVSYRAYLQPDPQRPYAVVAVVAFDLAHTRLHYVLGFEEPYAPNGPKRSGAMPAGDKLPGRLLAMFNGGFKAANGEFGAMSGGIVALPPRPGLGTLAIYQDGSLRMGVWGSDLQPSADMQAWRQNGPLVVQDGQINPDIYNNSPQDWGYTVKDVSPTWRSGIALSQDRHTLYYFAGPSLSMEALAKSMLAAHVAQGMQLDINNYWVHFVAVHWQNGELSLEALFPGTMKENIDRYLYPYGRDFFYVTTP